MTDGLRCVQLSGTMTTAELLSRAKRSIESCKTSLRAAAEDIARAYEQGAKQREVAEGVGKCGLAGRHKQEG